MIKTQVDNCSNLKPADLHIKSPCGQLSLELILITSEAEMVLRLNYIAELFGPEALL